MGTKRVVITGMGVVSPIGETIDTYWNGLISGESGIDTIQSFDISEFPTQFAGECIGFETDTLPPKEIRRTARFILLALEFKKTNLLLNKVKDTHINFFLNSSKGIKKSLQTFKFAGTS